MYAIPQDGEVHHYTDTGGLIGILQSGSLWATNIQFLNDSLEYDFGLQKVSAQVLNALKRARTEKTFSEGNFPELEETVGTTLTILEGMREGIRKGMFVCCLSNYRDDLSQWRGYAREGYCITFDREELIKSIRETQEDANAVRYGNIIYGDGMGWELTPQIDGALAGMNDILSNPAADLSVYGIGQDDPIFGDPAVPEKRRAAAVSVGVAAVLWAIPLFKEEGFADEQEMRICVSHPNDVKFRPSAIGPIPYAELKFDPKSIRAVTVGPGLNIDLRESTLSYLLAHQFGKNHGIQINKTELSFRG
ncbi:DUF2971 domain-containing protein [Rhodococcus pyridinivorans]|uniref:DUF2971 domain-containing protein n=1 Tax=Rhodococcus pyridinivorans TaxID=103816 RepID=UPI00368794D5